MKIKRWKLSRKEISKKHLGWYFGLEASLRQLSDKVSAKMQMVRENKEYTMDYDESLSSMFFMHLSEYVSRAREVGPLGVGGVEPDISLLDMKGALGWAISRLWNEASMAYIHGEFRGCIFLSATMTEGALKLKIRGNGLEEDLKKRFKKPMLGNMIDFLEHDKRLLVPNEVIELAKVVNTLRVKHIHLLGEEEPQDYFKITEGDEFFPLDEFRGRPPIEIREGYISGDGVDLIIDLEKGASGILYKHKKDARESLDKSREILRTLYPKREIKNASNRGICSGILRAQDWGREKGELINMAQYDPLRDYLSECKGNELTRTFKEIDNIIAPKALPPSAYRNNSFWGNSTRRPKNKHVQAFAWYDAGWKVSKVDLLLQIVTFCRRLMLRHPEGQESTYLKKVILLLSPEHQHVIEALVVRLAKIEGIEIPTPREAIP